MTHKFVFRSKEEKEAFELFGFPEIQNKINKKLQEIDGTYYEYHNIRLEESTEEHVVFTTHMYVIRRGEGDGENVYLIYNPDDDLMKLIHNIKDCILDMIIDSRKEVDITDKHMMEHIINSMNQLYNNLEDRKIKQDLLQLITPLKKVNFNMKTKEMI